MGFKLDLRTACPVKKYAEQVISGQVVAGRLVELACNRHLRDLETGEQRGLFFDRAASERAIYFIEMLRHTKGEWGGRLIKLEPWQKFIIGSIFGWKIKASGYRRYTKAYDEVARKNGKSTICGGVGLYMLTADKEPGAEVYTAATKKEQASIVFNEASNMVKALPPHYDLRKQISVFSNTLIVEKTASKMEPLSADAKKQDGLNPHAAIVDELHAHETRDLLDVLDTALGARRQPLMFLITTAGFNRHGPCVEEREYAVKVLEQTIEDDSTFVYIATLDEGDDPFDEAVWIKANPNLGIAPKMEYLQKQARKAKETPSFYNEFLTKHLNIWTQTDKRWLPDGVWEACSGPVILKNLVPRRCFGGLDLSSTTDITAFAKLWEPVEDDPFWRLGMRFWLPGDDLKDRAKRDKAPYENWVRDGHIELTSGNVIDHDFIQSAVEADWDEFNIVDIGFDPFNATMLTTRLISNGLALTAFRQGFLSMSPAVKFMETIVMKKQLGHGGNPVLGWMASNVVMRRDPAGNIKPDKEKARNKIDGIVAAIMALGRATATPEESESRYETQGLTVIGGD